MKRLHITHCLLAIAAAVVLLLIAGVNAGTLVLLAAVLACPLMVVFMMRGMTDGDGHGGAPDRGHQRTGETSDTSDSTGLAR